MYRGHPSYRCNERQDADGVTATQACSVACTGGDVKSCPEYDNCWDSPCLNGGVCTDGVGIFTCACPPPLASTTDAEDNCSDECAANPCLNGGVCVDGIGTYFCLDPNQAMVRLTRFVRPAATLSGLVACDPPVWRAMWHSAKMMKLGSAPQVSVTTWWNWRRKQVELAQAAICYTSH